MDLDSFSVVQLKDGSWEAQDPITGKVAIAFSRQAAREKLASSMTGREAVGSLWTTPASPGKPLPEADIVEPRVASKTKPRDVSEK